MSLQTHHIQQPIHLVTKLLSHTRSIVITTHVNPDGDAIGSACAMLLALRHLRKNVVIINVSPTPKNLQFLPGAQDIQVYDSSKHDDVLRKADMILCLDFNTPKRVNEMEHAIRSSEATKVMIDHHIQPEDFYSAAIHDVDATSTGELVYKLLAISYPETINAGVAANIYAAMMTDSGNFRFPRVSSETHTIIADLLQRGADPVSIYEHIFNTSSMPRMLMLGEALAGMTLHHNGKLCVMVLTRDMFERTGCREDDTEGFVHNTLSIEGVVCGLLVVEKEGEIKFSYRSKGNTPANLMAATFGGGGHLNAAGARAKGIALHEALQKAIDVAGNYLH